MSSRGQNDKGTGSDSACSIARHMPGDNPNGAKRFPRGVKVVSMFMKPNFVSDFLAISGRAASKGSINFVSIFVCKCFKDLYPSVGQKAHGM